ncbi:DUF4124 domain-containing protein [Methylomonas paludis]|uniref:DUF4124 domain-containing protein n=1 Tax=Methylomonas paludis TaxID=1173101 RepID=A0A975MN14_9GAMM|nr:DUF4124 domain-containing protein [Methylomonas paludis]QWF70861.1 DUF4124 domain-containing protein [Methylomonas paludis]
MRASPIKNTACKLFSLILGLSANTSYADIADYLPAVPDNFWSTPIPANTQLDPNSSNYVNEFIRQFNTYYGTVAIMTEAFSAPVFIADSSTPVVPVTQLGCQNTTPNPGLKAQLANVPVPAGTVSPADSDGEVVIYDPTSDTLWEFWKMQNVNGNWQACWGGQIPNFSTSNSIFPWPYGATATGLPLASGQITAEEIQSGQINHVIGIALVDLADKSIFSWPANRSDGSNPNNIPNRIPAGTHFRLDPTINVDALKLTPAGKVIAKAAQTYGFVVWDKSGALTLRAQNVLTYTSQGLANPYPAVFGGKANWAVLQNFPWNRLQFLPQNYGQQ